MSKLILLIVLMIVFGGGVIFILPQLPQRQTDTSISSPSGSMVVTPTVDALATPTPTPEPEVVEVEVTSAGFDPQTLIVRTGTEVTWINKSRQMVNISSDLHPTHLLYPVLNLGNFEAGQSVSLLFDQPGSYKYHNHLKPTVTGVVIVEKRVEGN